MRNFIYDGVLKMAYKCVEPICNSNYKTDPKVDLAFQNMKNRK